MNKGGIARGIAKINWHFLFRSSKVYGCFFLKSVVQVCADNESVRLADFRIFPVRVMTERKGRNPQTGEVMNLPSRRAVSFIPASDFRHKIEG